MSMSNLHGLAKQVGDDWVGGVYYEAAEKDMGQQWDRVIWPIIKGADFSETLDLAAGHGRNTARLLEHAVRIIAVDINKENIDVLSTRFRGNDKVVVLKNSGSDLRDVAGSSITFLYSFDAMVHFDSEIVHAYLREFRRVMKPGARGFCHYSNNYQNPTGSYQTHPGWRNFMSRQLFEHWLTRLGFRVVRSLYIKGVVDITETEVRECDAITLFQLPADAEPLDDFLVRQGDLTKASDHQTMQVYTELDRLNGVVRQVTQEHDELKVKFKWLQNENLVANKHRRDLEAVNEELRKEIRSLSEYRDYLVTQISGLNKHAEGLEGYYAETKTALLAIEEYKNILLAEKASLTQSRSALPEANAETSIDDQRDD